MEMVQLSKHASPTWTRGDHVVTTDLTRIDVDAVLQLLHSTFWAAQRSRETLDTSLEHSIAFGLLDRGATVGFARVVTDYATFAHLCDVIVAPSHRGAGLGAWLVECVLAHPALQGLRRISLVTRDAYGLYTKFGFTTDTGGSYYMERVEAPSFDDAAQIGVGEAVSYRRARPDDAPSISDVLLAAFKPYESLYTDGGFAATAIPPSEVEQRMREGPMWVAEVAGEIVGTVSAVVRGTALYIRGMAVVPSAQRCGIGDHLLEEAERFGGECGSTELELSTTQFLSSARALYERHGFQYVGDVSSLHGTPLFPMRKALSPHTG